MTAQRESTVSAPKPKPDQADRIYAAVLQAKAQAIADQVPWSHDLAVQAIRAQLAVEYPPTLKPLRRVNGRSPLFDAMAQACGCSGAGCTRHAATQIGAAVAQIVEIWPAITPEEMLRVSHAARRRYEKCGPMGIATHAHEFMSDSAKRTRAAQRDVYQEPQGDWRGAALTKYPNALEWVNAVEFCTVRWADVPLVLREDILKVLYP